MDKNEMIPSARVGSYMHSSNGRKLFPFDPRPAEMHIDNIAHHLANTCRYNGATQHKTITDRIFYSVAEHSVYCSYIGSSKFALERLLHDAAEHILGDIIRPLKHAEVFSGPYKELEVLNEEALAKRFGLIYPYPSCVKSADEAVTAAECEQIVCRDPSEEWISGRLHDDSKIAPFKIEMLLPFEAKTFFLQRFNELWDSDLNIRRISSFRYSFGCIEI